MKVSLTVGRGAWAFYRPQAELRVIPNVGDQIAASGDGRVYTVERVIVTPDTVYVRCHEPFQSEEEAIEAGKEWPE